MMQRAAGSITRIFATSKINKTIYVLVDLGRQVVLQKACESVYAPPAAQKPCRTQKKNRQDSANACKQPQHSKPGNEMLFSGGIGVWRRDGLAKHRPGKVQGMHHQPTKTTVKTRQLELIQGGRPLEEGSINLVGQHPGKCRVSRKWFRHRLAPQ